MNFFPGQAVIFNRDCRSALLQFNDVPASWANKYSEPRENYTPQMNMGVSKNSGTPKCMVYNGKPFKLDNLGYHHLRKHPYRNIPPQKTLTNMTDWAGRFSPLFFMFGDKTKAIIHLHPWLFFQPVMLVFRGVDLNLPRVVFLDRWISFFFLNVGEKTHETFWTLWCNVDVEMSIFFLWASLEEVSAAWMLEASNCQQKGDAWHLKKTRVLP